MSMDDIYNSETTDNELHSYEQELFEQYVIQNDEDLLVMHHFLNEVFRGSRQEK